MYMQKILGKSFFDRRALIVAPELLGKFLVKKSGKKEIALMITEVEAYDGFNDRASHAYKGKTKRNEVMFGPAGHWYVYLTYGMYYMLNVVVGEQGYPAALLIRGVETIIGPGRLTRDLNINKRFNKKEVSRTTGLWIEDRGVQIHKKNIKKTPRIGVTYAGDWAQKPYRFVLK